MFCRCVELCLFLGGTPADLLEASGYCVKSYHFNLAGQRLLTTHEQSAKETK